MLRLDGVGLRPPFALALLLLAAACQKPAPTRSRDDCDRKDCEDCPKPAPAASATGKASADAGGDDLCRGLEEQSQLDPALRALIGDLSVYGAMPGAPALNAPELLKTLQAKGAIATEPIAASNVSVARDRRKLHAASLFNTPEGARARSGLAPYVKAGRLPEIGAHGEVALGRILASDLGVELGDKVTVLGPPPAMAAVPPVTLEATVVGLLDFPFFPMLEYDGNLILASLRDARAAALLLENETQGYRVWLPDGDKTQRIVKLASAPLFATRAYTANTVEQVEGGVLALRLSVEALCRR